MVLDANRLIPDHRVHRLTGPLMAWLAVACLAAPAATQQGDAPQGPTENPDHAEYILPPPSVQDILATDKNYATLDYRSPDGDHFLIPWVTELSTLELMSRPTYRLAELELRPATDRLWHLDTYGVYDFKIYSLSEREYVDVDLPEGSFASDFTWSPEGSRIAFLHHLPDHTEMWTAEAASGRLQRVSDARVLATVGTSAGGQGHRPSNMLQWTPEGTLITLLVPADRGSEPSDDRIPTGPVMRRTRERATASRTYPNLMEDEHDEALFEHYTRSQMAELAPGQDPRPMGEPAMWESLSVSPDGTHVMATRIERPFSYITSYRGFPRETVILDRDGNEVASLNERPLNEGGGGFGRGGGGGGGRRSMAWRPDGAGLSWLERAEREEGADEDALRPDRIMLGGPPFDAESGRVIATSDDPISSVTYSLDGEHALASVSRDGEQGLVHFDLTQADPQPTTVVDFHASEGPLDQTGDLVTLSTANGLSYVPVSDDGAYVLLEGDGYQADFRPRPFIDRVSLADGTTTRIFQGATDSFDQPLMPLAGDFSTLIVTRESVTDFPDSYLWTSDGSGGGSFANLTNNVDPFPEVTAARRMDFEFRRRDGLPVQGRVSMPVGWEEGDGKVPAIFWTYPREYEEAEDYENAAIRSRNKNAFTHMSWLRWSDIWLTQGYALVYPDIPIIGENYNDTYIASLVDAMYAAIRGVDALGVIDIDRIGHGGHSYGAFATANILANAPFFKAGIAGDGAYNRSLTPSGFQAERRSIWEAPHTYIEMSPFFRADQIDTPLLMYHGGDDNNTGTFPIQSRRMIHALTNLGKTAVLYEYPYESHTPRAMANKLDMWARFLNWFDTYVKDAGDGERIISEGSSR